ncbi:MAG: hypothetical protein ACKVVT_01945 [Dehalococcoidia bacterium]
MSNVEAELATVTDGLAAFGRLRTTLWPAVLQLTALALAGLPAGAPEAARLAAQHAATGFREALAATRSDLDALVRLRGATDALWSMLAAMQPAQVRAFDQLCAAEAAIRADILAFEAGIQRAKGLVRLVEEVVVVPGL